MSAKFSKLKRNLSQILKSIPPSPCSWLQRGEMQSVFPIHRDPALENAVSKAQATYPHPQREAGPVQLTGKEIQVGQLDFPDRTPADPSVFVNSTTGEAEIYGTG